MGLLLQVQFSERQILVDGRPDLLLGGEFQYFRIAPELWRPSLEKVREAGLNVISAYVPWSWHEPREGEFDFDGTTDPARDLQRFLALCAELELPLVLKPGPYIFAEYRGFGVPEWIYADHPELLMRVKKPQAYPQPSLNHPQFLALVARWFERVAAIVRPAIAEGRVIALQIDNETGYPQFGQGPHMSDTNPEALVLLRQALADRFSSITELNQVWGTDFADFDAIVPPEERLCNAAQIATLTRYVEDYIVLYLRNLQELWRQLDVETFYFLNDIWLDSWPSHIGKKNTVAPLAFDIYPRYSDLDVPFDQPFCISYVPKLFGAFLRGGPLMAAEMGCGWLDPACEVSPRATWQSTMAAYAHGTKACFFYTAMDGRDGDGDYIFRPLLNVDGQELPRMDAARDLARFRREWGAALAVTQELQSRVAVLHYPAITRQMMTAALAPIETILKGSHRALDEVMTIVSVNAGLYGALAEAGYNPTVVNLERATPEELAAYEVVLFNSIGVVDATNQHKLQQYVRGGGRLVTLGMPFSEESTLFPARVSQVLNPQAGSVLMRMAWEYAKLYWRLARQFTHKFCAYTVEGMFPAMLMTRLATRTGVWMRDPVRNARVWASRLVTLSKLGPTARPLLRYRGQIAGYEADVGDGLSVFLGTLLGASFDSPGFYLDAPARKRSVSNYLGRLLQSWAVLPEVSPIDDVETVVRESERHRLAFLFNRGASKPFTLSINRPWQGYFLTRTFAAGASQARWEGDRLVGTIEQDDVLCVMWERPE
ncbi:MAG TPA: alpha-amylase family protein [Oscillatoriaceae cyanobacterium]